MWVGGWVSRGLARAQTNPRGVTKQWPAPDSLQEPPQCIVMSTVALGRRGGMSFGGRRFMAKRRWAQGPC